MIKQKIFLHNQEIEYTVNKSRRARNVRITINCDASVRLTCPWYMPESLALKFLTERGVWVLKNVAKFKKYDSSLMRRGGNQDYLKNKIQARNFILERVEIYNKFFNFKINRVAIRNQSTRWGSCSSKKYLNFNYKLFFLPEELADYVVVHEICHLKHLNHSKDFWDLVGQVIPDFKERRKKLKKILI